jgi:hypothetical protein
MLLFGKVNRSGAVVKNFVAEAGYSSGGKRILDADLS